MLLLLLMKIQEDYLVHILHHYSLRCYMTAALVLLTLPHHLDFLVTMIELLLNRLLVPQAVLVQALISSVLVIVDMNSIFY